MNQILLIFLVLIIVIIVSYFIGKFFAKGLLKEIDLYLGRKFVDYVNNKTKKEKNGKTEKTEQF